MAAPGSQKNERVDDDEDRRNPQYIPKRGTFYEHDDRTAPGDEEGSVTGEGSVVSRGSGNHGPSSGGAGDVGTPGVETGVGGVTPGPGSEQRKQRQSRASATDKWTHDKYNENDQAPKSSEELMAIYGYDIRAEEGPPRAFRRRKYGRGPNKYTRNWEDEQAYSTKPSPGVRTPRAPQVTNGEEFPTLQGANERNNKMDRRRNGTTTDTTPKKIELSLVSPKRPDVDRNANTTSTTTTPQQQQHNTNVSGDQHGGNNTPKPYGDKAFSNAKSRSGQPGSGRVAAVLTAPLRRPYIENKAEAVLNSQKETLNPPQRTVTVPPSTGLPSASLGGSQEKKPSNRKPNQSLVSPRLQANSHHGQIQSTSAPAPVVSRSSPPPLRNRSVQETSSGAQPADTSSSARGKRYSSIRQRPMPEQYQPVQCITNDYQPASPQQTQPSVYPQSAALSVLPQRQTPPPLLPLPTQQQLLQSQSQQQQLLQSQSQQQLLQSQTQQQQIMQSQTQQQQLLQSQSQQQQLLQSQTQQQQLLQSQTQQQLLQSQSQQQQILQSQNQAQQILQSQQIQHQQLHQQTPPPLHQASTVQMHQSSPNLHQTTSSMHPQTAAAMHQSNQAMLQSNPATMIQTTQQMHPSSQALHQASQQLHQITPPMQQMHQSSTLLQANPQIMQPNPPIHQANSNIHQSPAPMLQSTAPLHQSSPTMHQPTPQIHQPTPQIHQPTPQIHQPTPQIHQPTPQIHQASPQILQPSPQMHQPSPQIHQPNPQIHQATPQIHQASPQIHQASPTIHQQTQQIHQPTQPIHQANPPIHQASSGIHQVSPPLQTQMPRQSTGPNVGTIPIRQVQRSHQQIPMHTMQAPPPHIQGGLVATQSYPAQPMLPQTQYIQNSNSPMYSHTLPPQVYQPQQGYAAPPPPMPYHHQTTPPYAAHTGRSVYRESSGITFYSPQEQKGANPAPPTRRPTNAIPIVPPPARGRGRLSDAAAAQKDNIDHIVDNMFVPRHQSRMGPSRPGDVSKPTESSLTSITGDVTSKPDDKSARETLTDKSSKEGSAEPIPPRTEAAESPLQVTQPIEEKKDDRLSEELSNEVSEKLILDRPDTTEEENLQPSERDVENFSSSSISIIKESIKEMGLPVSCVEHQVSDVIIETKDEHSNEELQTAVEDDVSLQSEASKVEPDALQTDVIVDESVQNNESDSVIKDVIESIQVECEKIEIVKEEAIRDVGLEESQVNVFDEEKKDENDVAVEADIKESSVVEDSEKEAETTN